MKCEICHSSDAETAIVRGEGDSEQELYVCRKCAKEVRLKKQSTSQRTRRISGLPSGMEMSITEIGGDGTAETDAPPIIGELVNALQDMVSDIGKTIKEKQPERTEKMHDFPLARVDAEFKIGNRLHLEGLSLIGEIDAVKRAFKAMKMELVGINVDGISESGHAYEVKYGASSEQAKRVICDLLREERNARERLRSGDRRVFGDSLCRALAILKNCRLLTPGEYFDLLSPLRLASRYDMLEGIGLEEIEQTMLGLDLTGSEDTLTPKDRDRCDGERADQVNRRFWEVLINDVL